jgi:hypothetical protein
MVKHLAIGTLAADFGKSEFRFCHKMEWKYCSVHKPENSGQILIPILSQKFRLSPELRTAPELCHQNASNTQTSENTRRGPSLQNI